MTTDAKKLKCGLVMPISAIDGCSDAHWDEVRFVIKEALEGTDFAVELVSDSNEIGIIQKRIVQNLYDNDIVICDVSAKNPNVMFELGMRLAFDKPAIIIKDDKTNYSFDTSPIEHLQYPRDLHYHTIQAFKIKLREKILATWEASKKDTYTTFLKHFGQFVVAKLDEKPIGKDEFVLEAISDLRNEVRSLAKTSRSRDEERISESNIRMHVNGERSMRETTDLILDFIRRSEGAVKLEDLRDSGSLAFQQLLDHYVATSPSGVLTTERAARAARNNLQIAVNRIPHWVVQ